MVLRRFFVMIMAIVCIGCLNVQSNKLTLHELLDELEQRGVKTEQIAINDQNVFQRTLRDTKPAVYRVEENHIISVYVYGSKREVKQAIRQFEANTAAADVTSHIKYQLHNVLLFSITEDEQASGKLNKVMEELGAVF